MSKANPTELTDLIARVYKLEHNEALMKKFVAEFIESHNKLAAGCEGLEKMVRDHIGNVTVDDKPRIVVPSGEG